MVNLVKTRNSSFSEEKKCSATAIIIAVFVFTIDQLVKIALDISRTTEIATANRLFSMHYDTTSEFLGIVNSNFLGFVVICSLLALFYLAKRNYIKTIEVPLLLTASGVLSNMADRIRLGHVVDYLHLENVISSNLADIAIWVGCLWTIWIVLRTYPEAKKQR